MRIISRKVLHSKTFFLKLGIVEEVGKGTRTLFKYVPLISAGQGPSIEEQDEYKVTNPYLMAGPAAEDVTKDVIKELTERQLFILNELHNDGTLSAMDLSRKTGAVLRTIRRDLSALQAAGLLSREGGRKEWRWIVHD